MSASKHSILHRPITRMQRNFIALCRFTIGYEAYMTYELYFTPRASLFQARQEWLIWTTFLYTGHKVARCVLCKLRWKATDLGEPAYIVIKGLLRAYNIQEVRNWSGVAWTCLWHSLRGVAFSRVPRPSSSSYSARQCESASIICVRCAGERPITFFIKMTYCVQATS